MIINNKTRYNELIAENGKGIASKLQPTICIGRKLYLPLNVLYNDFIEIDKPEPVEEVQPNE